MEWRTASGTWFGETPRQSQAEPVKQQHTGISPNQVPEAVRYWRTSLSCVRILMGMGGDDTNSFDEGMRSFYSVMSSVEARRAWPFVSRASN